MMSKLSRASLPLYGFTSLPEGIPDHSPATTVSGYLTEEAGSVNLSVNLSVVVHWAGTDTITAQQQQDQSQAQKEEFPQSEFHLSLLGFLVLD